jgi:hypothetical protein
MLGVRTGLLVTAALGAVALAGCSNSPSASTGSTTSPTTAVAAACTRSAITAGAMRTKSAGPVSAVNGYGCSGSWAYADVVVGTTNSFEAVLVLEAVGSDWTVADRATACTNHLVPSAIYTQACTTS